MGADCVAARANRIAEHRYESIVDKRCAPGAIDDQITVTTGVLAAIKRGRVGEEHIKAPEIKDKIDLLFARNLNSIRQTGQEVLIQTGNGAAAVSVEFRCTATIGKEPPAYRIGALLAKVAKHRTGCAGIIGMLVPLFYCAKIGAETPVKPWHIGADQKPPSSEARNQMGTINRTACRCTRRCGHGHTDAHEEENDPCQMERANHDDPL
jgi:hypothetical protein